MSQEIIDIEARKYKKVKCPVCGRSSGISVENYNEDGEFIYICMYDEEIFELDEDETYYDGYDEEWQDLTEDHIYMLEE